MPYTKKLPSCYCELLFLRAHCSNMLSFFIDFFLSLSSVLVSFPSLFSLLSHFSSVAPSHPSFFLSLSPSQPTLSPLQSRNYPGNTRKSPIAITQKPNKKNQKISTEKYPKPHWKYPEKKKSILKLPLYTPPKIAPKPSNKTIKNPQNLIANPLLRSCVVVSIGVGWVQWWNREALPRLDQRDRSLDRLGSGLNSEIEQRMRLLSAVVGGDELE